jgi:hypothetical protein
MEALRKKGPEQGATYGLSQLTRSAPWLRSMKGTLSRCIWLGMLMSLAACSDTATTQVASAALLSVAPAAGATDVGASPTIEVRLDQPVSAAVMQPIALQVGDCPGPVVPGQWTRTTDGFALRFEPSQPLTPSTRYTIHVGGGVTDSEGASVDLELRGPMLGGEWVTREMVMGMTGMQNHSGPQWLYTPNGLYGLAFAFTTAP